MSPQSKKRIGPLLEHALNRVESTRDQELRLSLASDFGGDAGTGSLRIVAQSDRVQPVAGEGWKHFRERAVNLMGPLADALSAVTGESAAPLLAAGAVQLSAQPGLIRELPHAHQDLRLELDPLVEVATMDDVLPDVELPLLLARDPP